MKDWNPAAPARSPCSRKHMYRTVWSLPMIQRRTGWKCCGQMRPKSSPLASTQLAVFGGGGMLPMTPRTPYPPSNMEGETLCFGGVFLLRRQDNCTASNGHVRLGTGHWSQPGHWKWVLDRHVQRGGRRVLEHLPLCTMMPKVPFYQGIFFIFIKHPSVKACPM